MDKLVLDASAAANFLLPDESNDYGERVLLRIEQAGAVVPALWNYEVGNLLSMALRRDRIDERYREIALARLLTLRISYWDADGLTSLIHAPRIARLADKYELSFYDASYLYIAHTLRLPLASLDKRLTSTAKRMKIRLVA